MLTKDEIKIINNELSEMQYDLKVIVHKLEGIQYKTDSARLKSYIINNLKTMIDKDHSVIGGSPVNLEDIKKEIQA